MSSYADALNAALGNKPRAAIPEVVQRQQPTEVAVPERAPRPQPIASNVQHLSDRIVRPVSSYEAECHRNVMTLLTTGKLRPWEHYHSLQVKDKAMFGEPINGSPWVFVDSEEPVIVVFTALPGSGTDHLRKRINAQQFFDSLE